MSKTKKFLLAAFMFIGAILGGFLGMLVFPSLISRLPILSSIEFLNIGGERITVIREQPKEIIIDKADSISRAVEKVKSSIVVIEKSRKGQTLSSVSAVVVTSDGWILAPYSIVQSFFKGQDKFFIILPGEKAAVDLVKADNILQVALFVVQNKNFYTPEFVSKNELSLGDTVFLLSSFETEILENSIEVGYISKITSNSINFSTDFGDESVSGGAVFSTEGKFIALSVKNAKDQAVFIPVEKISDFMASARQ